MSIQLLLGLLVLGSLAALVADRLAPLLTAGRAAPATRWQQAPVTGVTAAAFAAAGFVYGPGPELAAVLALLAVLAAVTITDLRSSLIPNRLLLLALPVTVPAVLVSGLRTPGEVLAGGAACGGLMLLIAIAVRGGMGGGDVKFSGYIGLALGWRLGLLALVLGVMLGGLAGVVSLISRRRGIKDAIPYGPYLALGAAAALLWGGPLLRWYLGG